MLITWDNSDGWYDSILGPIETQSQTPIDNANGSGDALTAPGQCGSQASQVPQTDSGMPEQGRCGLGPRLPCLVVSPWANSNDISSTLTDQSSVVKFIEYNWHLPALGNGAADTLAGSIRDMFDFHGGGNNKALFLDPTTGEPLRASSWQSTHNYTKR